MGLLTHEDLARQTILHAVRDLLSAINTRRLYTRGVGRTHQFSCGDLGKAGRRGAGVIAEHTFDDNLDAMQAMGTAGA